MNEPTTAVIACHFINDIMGAHGALAAYFRNEIESREVISHAEQLIEGARDRGWPIVWTAVGFRPDGADLDINIPLLAMVHELGCLQWGSPGTDFLPELTPRKHDYVIRNAKVSGFAASPLDALLRSLGVQRVILAGVATNITIESTGRAAGDLGYAVIIAEDACSAADQAAHEASIATFALLGATHTVSQILS